MTSPRRTCRCTALRTASTCPPPPPSCSTRRPASGVSRKRAAARRDYMINREGIPYPDDSGHVKGLQAAGATVVRGTARITARGRVDVTDGGRAQELAARNIVIAVGSTTKVPPVEGIEGVHVWTNNEATGARELPRSLLVMGGGR